MRTAAIEGIICMQRTLKRSLAVAAVPVLAFMVGMFAWTGTAAAHNVSNVDVDCTHVTVHFTDFPDAGVMVHIVAEVEGHAAISTDVLVKNDMSANLNISAATGLLFGVSADVEVDVTWTLYGAQHVHKKLSVMCGTTTTTVGGGTTTTVGGHGTTSTTVAGQTTSTTVGGQATTTTTVVGGGTTTTVAGGGTTTTTTIEVDADVDNDVDVGGGTTAGTDSGPGVSVLGDSAVAGTASGSLPATGSATPTMVGAGLGLLAVGGALLAARRRAVS